MSFDIDNGTTGFRDTVRAKDIVRAASVAAIRYPRHDIRLSLPVDPDAFFAGSGEEMPVEKELAGGRQV